MLREMEKALARNKTLETLTLLDDDVSPLKEFCRHVLLATRRNTSLSDVRLDFSPPNWDCPDDGIGWCICRSYCVTELDVVHSM